MTGFNALAKFIYSTSLSVSQEGKYAGWRKLSGSTDVIYFNQYTHLIAFLSQI